MQICLSGSMAAIGQIEALGKALRALGHVCETPARGTAPDMAPRLEGLTGQAAKAVFVADHLDKMRRSDAVLIANFDRNGVGGYVGTSALLEAGMAYALGKSLFVLHLPGRADVAGDLAALGAICLDGDLAKLTG